MKKKIRKSVSKRFKVTKTGKILFGRQYQSHHKLVKSKRRIRKGKRPGILASAMAKKVKKMLGA